MPSTSSGSALPSLGAGNSDTADSRRQHVLARLSSLSDAAYEELLAVPAEHALERLGVDAVSLSRWERDRGVLRCLVNAGHLGPGEQRFPTDEIYDLAEWHSVLELGRGQGVAYQLDDPGLPDQGRLLLEGPGYQSAASAPVYIGDRLWGELWAARRSGSLGPHAVDLLTEVASEISGMISLAERLEHMSRLAFQDPLTGLGNRRQLDDSLAALLGPGGPGTTVIVCDVNDLKRINDEDGHQAGDNVIIAVADALSSAAAPLPGAVTIRLGGDEFAVLLSGPARGRAIDLVTAASRTLSAHTPAVGISCGVAVVHQGVSPRDALAVADAAQYAAKRRGALLLVADESTVQATARTTVVTTAQTTVPTAAQASSHPVGVPEPREGPRRRFRDVTADSASSTSSPTSSSTADATARTLLGICDDLGSVPAGPRARLIWLAEHLLAGFDLHTWSLSTVDLTGDRLLRITSIGLREGQSIHDADRELLVDALFPIDDFPVSEEAVRRCGWFTAGTDDDQGDPSELAVLQDVGRRFVVAVGWSDDVEGLLLEVYGQDGDRRLVGATAALAAAAVLGRPLREVTRTASHA